MNDTPHIQQQFFEMLLDSQWWSAERLLDYQRSQLGQLLRHARTNVPFYENRLDILFRGDGSIDWERWSEVPIVRRSDMAEHREAMQAKVLPPGHGPTGVLHSSGSTGVPIAITVTGLARLASDAARWRSNLWAGLDFSKTMCIRHGEDPKIAPPDGLETGIWGPPWDPQARKGRSFQMNRLWSSGDQLDFVMRHNATYVSIGVPKVAHTLALEAQRRGIEHRIDAFLVNGEATGAEDRDICREVFGARIVDLYSSKEGAHMAHPCPSGHGLHVNAELLLLEIVDDRDRSVPPGTSGRVIITPLFSTGQPLIRYDQGDIGVLSGGCSCGRGLPHLERLDGRVTHMFRHPDGRRILRGLPERFRQLLDAGMWQIAQTGPLDFEIRYVPRDWTRSGDEAAVADGFRQWYFDDARVSFKRLHELVPTPAGKFIEYVYEAGE